MQPQVGKPLCDAAVSRSLAGTYCSAGGQAFIKEYNPNFMDNTNAYHPNQNIRGFNMRNSIMRIAVVALTTLIAGVANAEEQSSPAKLTAYSMFNRQAKTDLAANLVELPSAGMFRVQCDSPAKGIVGKVKLNGQSLWVEGEDEGIWLIHEPGRFGSRDVNVDISFEKPSFSFAITVDGYQGWSVDGLRIILANGQDIPLASLFVEGHEELRSKHLLQHKAYETPPVTVLSSEKTQSLTALDWRLQRGMTSLSDALPQEMARIERIISRQAARRSPEATALARQALANLAGQAKQSTPEHLARLHLEVRHLKRELLLSDPAIDFKEILCVDSPYIGADGHQVRTRNEDIAVPGGRLLVVNGLGPNAVPRQIAPRPGEPAASFWRPDLSFDAQKVLYSMKSAKGRSYNLYEIGLDGNGHRQITASDYNDNDPIYAPDGGIIFVTTRANQFLRCGGSTYRMGVLARADANGRNIYLLSTNNEIDHLPTFLPDGRVLFCRWEYIDKEVMRVQGLWTMNPDGTSLQAFWGNQSQWPDIVWNAHPIPGDGRYLFNPNSHHYTYDGGLGVLDPGEGMNYPDGVYNMTPHLGWLEGGRGPQDKTLNPEFTPPKTLNSFLSPFPISKDLFLVSARFGKFGLGLPHSDLRHFCLYLMDYDGNMELLYQGAFNILFAQPVRPRPVPRVIPQSTVWPGRMTAADQQAQPGMIYSADVYEGSNIPRGLAKRLRVIEAEPLWFGDGNRNSGQETGAYHRAMNIEGGNLPAGETAMSMVYDEASKRILGAVLVEEDGSVYFELPSMTGVYFQLLDERGRALQTMRSITHVMPGERRGCVGCHETRAVAPPVQTSLAIRRPPSRIELPPWGDVGVSFSRFVQPMLDRNCISCHNGDKKAGDIDLTHRTLPDNTFSWPYATLLFGKAKNGKELPNTSYANPIWPYLTYKHPKWKISTPDTVVPPMTALSYNSRLLEIATGGKHHGVKISLEDEAKLIGWIDANCPYRAFEEIIEQPDPSEGGWLGHRYTYGPRMRTAPIVHRAFMQDDFLTQDDRIPKDADGKPLPSFHVENNRRVYRIPPAKEVSK